MKKLFVIMIAVCSFLPAFASAEELTPEQQFKKNFPQHKLESFTPTAVKGVYEVYDGRQIVYYLPEGDFIFLGSIITKEGKNLTQESNIKKMEAKMAELSLDKALKIGSGKTAVVEFLDPNCHYCRLSYKFFEERKKEVTMYIFFFPLSQNGADKIRHIFCSKDRVQTYGDAMEGTLDGKEDLNLCKNQEVEDLIKAHREAGAKVGVRATPMIYIKGKVVPGFDRKVIEKLLAE